MTYLFDLIAHYIKYAICQFYTFNISMMIDLLVRYCGHCGIEGDAATRNKRAQAAVTLI